MGIVQLSFDDYLPWWADSMLWEHHMADTVTRDTEDEAFCNLYHQARAVERAGRGLGLSPMHKTVLRLEYQCKAYNPHIVRVTEWIAKRMRHMGERQVEALLDEASAILYARELLGMDAAMDWLPYEQPQAA